MQTTVPSTQPAVVQSLSTMQTIWDAVVNSAPGRFLLLALVLGFMTQGIKKVGAVEGSAKKAFLMSTPSLLGMPFGLIPSFYPGVDVGIAVLLSMVAGALCVYVFDLVSGIADHLKVRTLAKANAKIDEVTLPPATPPVVGA